jgi:hypothetical protein
LRLQLPNTHVHHLACKTLQTKLRNLPIILKAFSEILASLMFHVKKYGVTISKCFFIHTQEITGKRFTMNFTDALRTASLSNAKF